VNEDFHKQVQAETENKFIGLH